MVGAPQIEGVLFFLIGHNTKGLFLGYRENRLVLAFEVFPLLIACIYFLYIYQALQRVKFEIG